MIIRDFTSPTGRVRAGASSPKKREPGRSEEARRANAAPSDFGFAFERSRGGTTPTGGSHVSYIDSTGGLGSPASAFGGSVSRDGGGGTTKPVGDEPSQQNVTYWEIYRGLVHGEVIVTIECCYNERSPEEQMTTSHSSQKYHAWLKRTEECIRSRFPQCQVVPIAKKRRLGSFEVQACTRNITGQLSIEVLHSKMETKRWPDLDLLIRKLTTYLPNPVVRVEVPAIAGITSAPVFLLRRKANAPAPETVEAGYTDFEDGSWTIDIPSAQYTVVIGETDYSSDGKKEFIPEKEEPCWVLRVDVERKHTSAHNSPDPLKPSPDSPQGKEDRLDREKLWGTAQPNL